MAGAVQESVYEIDLEPEDLDHLKREVGVWLATTDKFDLFPLDSRRPAGRLRWQQPPYGEQVRLCSARHRTALFVLFPSPSAAVTSYLNHRRRIPIARPVPQPPLMAPSVSLRASMEHFGLWQALSKSQSASLRASMEPMVSVVRSLRRHHPYRCERLWSFPLK